MTQDPASRETFYNETHPSFGPYLWWLLLKPSDVWNGLFLKIKNKAKEICSAGGLHSSFMGAIERGESSVTMGTADRLARPSTLPWLARCSRGGRT